MNLWHGTPVAGSLDSFLKRATPCESARSRHTSVYVYTCVCMYAYLYVCICMYTYVYICICKYMYVYVCIRMYTYPRASLAPDARS